MLFDVINLMDRGCVENTKIVCFVNRIINFARFVLFSKQRITSTHLLFPNNSIYPRVKINKPINVYRFTRILRISQLVGKTWQLIERTPTSQLTFQNDELGADSERIIPSRKRKLAQVIRQIEYWPNYPSRRQATNSPSFAFSLGLSIRGEHFRHGPGTQRCVNSTDLLSRVARRRLHLLFLSLSRRSGPPGPVNTQKRLPCARFAVRIARLAMREMLAGIALTVYISRFE